MNMKRITILFTIIFVSLSSANAQIVKIPQFVAHRGASWDAPENTISAIQLAWEQGTKIVEVDVRLTKDKHLVLFHDSNVNRFSDAVKFIKELNLSSLRELDVGSHKGSKWKGEKIPTLDEAFKTAPSDGAFLLDIKEGLDILEPLKISIQKSGLRIDQIKLMSPNINLIKKVREMFPEMVIYKLEFLTNLNGKYSAQKLNELKIDTISVRKVRGINKNFVKSIQNAGIKLFVWTINSPVEAEDLAKAGVDGIISDRPEFLKKYLENKAN